MPGVAIFSQKVRVAAPAAAALFLELRNQSSQKRLRLRELRITAETAVAAGGAVGIYRASNVPAGGTVTVSLGLDPAEPAGQMGIISTGWTTAPTVGAIPLDGSWVPSVIGGQAVLIWIPGEELILGTTGGAAQSIVLKAETALPALTIAEKHSEG